MKYAAPLVVSALASAAQAVSGCSFDNIVSTGFNAEFYRYPLLDISANDEVGFFVSGYQNYGGHFASRTGVTNLQFEGGIDFENYAQAGTIFGLETSASNFSVALTGYFLASETGSYTFEFSADDGFGVFIGSTGPCCENVNDTVTEVAQFSGTKGGNLTYVPGVVVTREISVSMEANTYYPIKIVYVNELTQWKLYTTVTSPSGTKSNDFSNVYQVSSDDKMCPAVTTTVTTATNSQHTTPGTFTPTNCDKLPTCTVEVVTPGTTTHHTTTVTVPTDSVYTVPGTFTPKDCSEVEACTVAVVTGGYGNYTGSFNFLTGSPSSKSETTTDSSSASGSAPVTGTPQFITTHSETTEADTSGTTGVETDTTATPDVVTVTNSHETVITVTQCLNFQCSTTSGVLSVVTTTIQDKETVYTTLCPLTLSQSAGAPADTVETTAPYDTVETIAPADTVETTAPYDTVETTTPYDTMETTAPYDTVETTTPYDTVETTAPADTPASTLAADSETETPAEATSSAVVPAVSVLSEASGSRTSFGIAGAAIAFAYIL